MLDVSNKAGRRLEATPQGAIVDDREPGAGFRRRLGAGLAAPLPIDWLL